MTTTAFPPATPVLNAMTALRQYLSTLTMDDLRRFGRQVLVVLAFLGGVLVAIAKRSHQLLKGLIILLRITADLLEQFDDWVEYMIHANTVRPSTPPQPAPAVHPLAELAQDLMDNTTAELRSITGARGKRSKRAMVDGFISMPV